MFRIYFLKVQLNPERPDPGPEEKKLRYLKNVL